MATVKSEQAAQKNTHASLVSAKDAEPEVQPRVVQRHGNATDTCIHYGWSPMTLHRLENHPELDFPMPSEVLGLNIRSFDEIDAWLRTKKKQKKPSTNKND